MNEFEMTLGGKYSKSEIKDIIKKRESEGYCVMNPQEAERFYKSEKKKYDNYKRVKDLRHAEEIMNKEGFI